MERMKPKIPLSKVAEEYPQHGSDVVTLARSGITGLIQAKIYERGGDPQDNEGRWKTAQELYDSGDILILGRRQERQFITLVWGQNSKLYTTWEDTQFPEILVCQDLSGTCSYTGWVQHFSPNEQAIKYPKYEGPFLSFQSNDGTMAVFLAWRPDRSLYEPLGKAPSPFIVEHTTEGWRALNVRDDQTFTG